MDGSVKPNTRLIELRLNAGLSQRALGYRAGVSSPTISWAEKGRLPDPHTQFAIAAVFDLKPLDIWPLEDHLKRQRERVG